MLKLLNDIRGHIISWVAFCGMMIALLKFLVMPWIQEVSRAESNRVLYVIYSELHSSYEAIPNKLPHHNAKLHELKEKQHIYRGFIQADYEKGLTTLKPE